jgi:hypothetical protein
MENAKSEEHRVYYWLCTAAFAFGFILGALAMKLS